MLFWNYSRSKIGRVNPPWCNTSFVISFRQRAWLDPYLVLHNFWLSNILLGSNACQTPCIDSIPHRLLFGSAPWMMTEISQMLSQCRSPQAVARGVRRTARERKKMPWLRETRGKWQTLFREDSVGDMVLCFTLTCMSIYMCWIEYHKVGVTRE